MPEREVNLDVEVEIRDADTAVVSVGGELDIETATMLHHHLANQFLHGRRHLVLDLSALDFMDSSGLNVLIRAGRDARESGGDLHLAAPTPAVRRILEITGLTMTTPLHADVADALVAAGHEG
ncbi:anti-sigma factor antagonist [Streptomyces cinereoruber]|uniref:Anti-sigma factor antagonist n=1 Tax=Streptomyces cinereoruber TaxID=67260 RepID=A0AAV4KGL5_9ACTN|nr:MULTISPECIES: STAS domain-containing protein [Streptomyces]AVH98834.1 anti-sigma factor antagonist [Streptomyces sp. WAC00288]KYG52267.1 anti-anti-sigma factor [Streptomyces sp. WAC04657]MBB4160495.1 stage II sporulation protein AA (anti-sigma F factor antagonist) [Streptomyces cinereoruber]MBY8820218.1 STAS domain-containing protein [Streptomyces cinereoruber]NIH62986.1 stage II sporulation protein AA (anti-sigma F factor antagonist) [Streptomyces cinereoruber]